MGYTLDQFAADCHAALKADPGLGGQEQVRDFVQKALQDEAFVEEHLGQATAERAVIYQDDELGFCICAACTTLAVLVARWMLTTGYRLKP